MVCYSRTIDNLTATHGIFSGILFLCMYFKTDVTHLESCIQYVDYTACTQTAETEDDHDNAQLKSTHPVEDGCSSSLSTFLIPFSHQPIRPSMRS